MVEFFADNFSNCVFLAVLLLALIPTVESKVAIPFGLSYAIWGDATLSPVVAFICAFIGSMLPCVIVIFVVRKIKNKTTGFLHDKFLQKFQNHYQRKLKELGKKEKTFQKLLFLAFFVAIPLPLTGVYSGSLIAGLSDLKILPAFVAIAVGELLSCLAILILCMLFENSVFYIFISSLVILGIFLIFELCFILIKKINKKRKEIN